jgi:hypothetical protein
MYNDKPRYVYKTQIKYYINLLLFSKMNLKLRQWVLNSESKGR